MYSLDEITDKYIGKPGTPKRDAFEQELTKDLQGHAIKTAPQNKWDDPEFVAEMEERVADMENGTDKGHSWEEVKENARLAIKAKTAK